MLEAKKAKKQKLEQEQLAAEFQVYPERFTQPVVMKTEAEQKMDTAFSLLKYRLHQDNPTPQDKLRDALDNLRLKAEGL